MFSSQVLVLVCFLTLLVNSGLATVCESSIENGKEVTADVNLGQTFVSPITGGLREIRIFVSNSLSVSATAELYSGKVLASKNSTYQAPVTYFNGSLTATFSHAPVVAGQQYTLLINFSSSITVKGGSYGEGSAIVDGTAASNDLSFELCFEGYNFKNNLFIHNEQGSVYIEALGLDADENMYLAGGFSGKVVLAPRVTYNIPGPFLAKYDNASNYLWSLMLVTDGEAQIMDANTNPDGYTVISGWFRGPLQFPTGTCPSTDYGNTDFFIALFAPNGTELWHKCFGWWSSSNNYQDGPGIFVTIGNDTAVYATGGFWGTINLGGQTLGEDYQRSVFVAKFGLAGNHIWSIRYPTGNGDAWSITKDNFYDDAIIVGVTYDNSFTIATATYLYGISPPRALIIKLKASDGSYIWHVEYGEPGKMSNPQSVSVDTEGAIAVVGVLDGSLYVGSVLFQGPGGGYVFKISPDGQPLWGHHYGGAKQYPMCRVKVGQDNTVYAIGYPRINTTVGGDVVSLYTGYLSAYSTDGDFLWQNTFTCPDRYLRGLWTHPHTRTIAWGSSFTGNTTLDGFNYTSTQYDAFVHLYTLDEKGYNSTSSGPNSGNGNNDNSQNNDGKLSVDKVIHNKTYLMGIIIIGGVLVLGILITVIAVAVRKSRKDSSDVEMN